MQSPGIVELVTHLTTIDVAQADLECCTGVLHDLTRLIAWAEAGKIDAAQRLAALAVVSPLIFPENVMATATRVSLGQALQPFRRATAIEAMPSFGSALTDGSVSAAHVDVIANAVTKLDRDECERFNNREEFLAGVAQRSTPGEFARTVRTEMLRCQRGDGVDVLQRQRKATYLKTWVDKVSGMWCLHGEFDPETGGRLAGRLTRTIEKLFHDRAPDTAPTDPLDQQHHLRALALVAIGDGAGAAGGGTDMSILIDATTLISGKHTASIIDFGLAIDLPIATVRRMACISEITPIIVGADGVRLHLGQTTRLASREQRRPARHVSRLRHPRLLRRLGLRRHPPPQILPISRRHRHRKFVAAVHQTSPLRPRRRLATHTLRQPNTDHHTPRRHHPMPQPTQSTGRMNPAVFDANRQT